MKNAVNEEAQKKIRRNDGSQIPRCSQSVDEIFHDDIYIVHYSGTKLQKKCHKICL